ncbi:MAG: AMP-binding protein [Desulfobacterales bacterium]
MQIRVGERIIAIAAPIFDLQFAKERTGMTHREIIDGWHPFTQEEINRYVAEGFWRNKTVCDLLQRNADVFPDKLAFADDHKEVTWRALYEKSNRIAIHLKRMGVQYGDFFVLQMVNVMILCKWWSK